VNPTSKQLKKQNFEQNKLITTRNLNSFGTKEKQEKENGGEFFGKV
jgi:hypothetical protein